MAVEYRGLRAEEEAAALDLWTAAFHLDREFLRREYHGDPRRRIEHTLVAVETDGALLSTVNYVLRDVRGPAGTVWRVGGIAYVATREDARRLGYSGRLLEDALEALRAERCDWSYLFTGVNRHYERYGWRTLPTRYRQGLLAADLPAETSGYAVRPFRPAEEPGGWEALAALYAAYNTARPLTTVRSLEHWRGFASLKFTEANAVTLTAWRNGTMCGYLLLAFAEEGFCAQEIGALPGDEAAIGALLFAAGRLARERGSERGRCYLPHEPPVDTALAQLFAGVEMEYHHSVMVRAIAPGFDDRQVDAAYAAPGAIFWLADDF